MPKRNVILIGLLLLAGVCVVLLVGRRTNSILVPQGPFPTLRQAHGLTQEHYYGPVPDDLESAALQGYMAALDPYCRYVSPAQQDQLNRVIHGQSVGLGLLVEIDRGRALVVGPLPDSPAQRAGLTGGDEILAIDDEPVAGIDLPTLRDRLAGPVDSDVTLRVRRGQREETLTLTRRSYPVETVVGVARRPDGRWDYMLDVEHGIGYIAITEFAMRTAQSFADAVQALLAEGGRSLVLDLRGNPGGPLDEAVSVADRFLDDGLIVLSRSRRGATVEHRAHPGRTLTDLPLVVLIDPDTASAAEIVAGSLRRHGRAVLVGRRTYGKDLIQTPYELDDGRGAILLTTSRYFFEDPGEDEPPASAGVAPHVLAEVAPADREPLRRLRERAAVLPAPDMPATQPTTTGPEGESVDRWLQLDGPLSRALHLLRRPESLDALLAE